MSTEIDEMQTRIDELTALNCRCVVLPVAVKAPQKPRRGALLLLLVQALGLLLTACEPARTDENPCEGVIIVAPEPGIVPIELSCPNPLHYIKPTPLGIECVCGIR